MPILGIFIWFLIGLLVERQEKLNYINLTEANKENQFSRTRIVMILIQNLSFMSIVLANEALLRYSVGMESNVPFATSLTLLALCLIAPIF